MDNMAAMTSAEARKLDLGLVVEKDSLKGVEETGAAVHDPDAHGLLIGHQYILDRPDSEGGPQMVKLNANGQLVSCEMLPHQLEQLEADHQSLVLHVVPQAGIKEAYNLQHLRGGIMGDERYIETLPPAVHYDQDLMREISEEDRRIAQTLMAVQYGQKHKMGLEPLVGSGPGPESNVIMSVGNSMIVDEHLVKDQMVVEYIQQVAAAADGSHYQPKVVRLMQHESELVQLAPARVDEEVLKQQSQVILRRTLTGVNHHEVQPLLEQMDHIKNEDEDDLELESDEDHDDSDYDAAKESRSSRRSLPHKKRIPKKLKGVKSAMRCGKCGECFASQAELITHRATHTKKQTAQPLLNFSCQLCNKGFPTQIKFFEHLKAHYEPIPKLEDEDEQQPELQQLQDDNVHNTELEEHLESKMTLPTVIVHELPPALPPPLACPHCNKVFRRQKAFDSHISTAHGHIQDTGPSEEMVLSETQNIYMSEALVPVAVCNDEVEKKEWAPAAELTPMAALPPEPEMRENTVIVPPPPQPTPIPEEHIMMTTEEDAGLASGYHLCDHCGTGFQMKMQLLTHIREMHSETKRRVRSKKEETSNGQQSASAAAAASKKSEQLTCPHCGRVFNHRNSLVYHLRSHTGERPHQCEVCGKSFFAASALKVHMRLHSGDKPYKCELCGRHFRQWGDLKYHCISIHTEEKQYQCEYCGKDFARKYSLIVHRRIHTGEKNYKCEFCGKTFRASSYLQNHRRIHTGEKPHPCDICGKPFRVRSDMKRHMNTHNRERGEGAVVHVRGTTVVATATEVEVGVTDLEAEEVTLPDEAVVMTEDSLSQPMNLNLAPAEHQGDATEMTAAAVAEQSIGNEEVHENGLQYSRDPLETVRTENGNTLYVWPIYMG